MKNKKYFDSLTNNRYMIRMNLIFLTIISISLILSNYTEERSVSCLFTLTFIIFIILDFIFNIIFHIWMENRIKDELEELYE